MESSNVIHVLFDCRKQNLKKQGLLFKPLLYNVAYIAINCQMLIVGQPWRRPELILPPPLPTSSRPFLRSWLRSLWWRRSNRHWGTLSKWVRQLFRINWMFFTSHPEGFNTSEWTESVMIKELKRPLWWWNFFKKPHESITMPQF